MTAPATTTQPVYTSREITILIWVLILPMYFFHTYLHSYGTKKTVIEVCVCVEGERGRAEKQVKHKWTERQRAWTKHTLRALLGTVGHILKELFKRRPSFCCSQHFTRTSSKLT